MGAVFCQKIFAFTLYAEVCAEITAAFHDVLGGVVQIGGAWVLQLRRAPAWPWQAEVVTAKVIAGFFVFAAFGLQSLHVKEMHIAHMRFETLWALAGVANGPDRFIDFAQDVFGHGFVHAFDFLQLVILDQLFTKAQFFSQLVHDHVVRATLPQRFDHFFTPLQGAVRCCARATGFKLRRSR